MTRPRRHLAGVEDSPALRMQYGRSGAWARIAHQDAQRLLDAIKAAAGEPPAPVLRVTCPTTDKDGGRA